MGKVRKMLAAGMVVGVPWMGRAGVALAELPSAVVTTAASAQSQHWFGVAVENIPPAFAKQLKLRPEQGLMVVAVMPNSPAEKAGLKIDDLLVELNGKPLMSQEELARAANACDGQTRAAVEARIGYLRDGTPATVEVTPGMRPPNMLVLGSNIGSFVRRPQSEGNGLRPSDFRNYVLPNGVAAQIGPGYRVRLNGSDASGGGAVTMNSIRKLVSNGQTVILSQETDASGAVRNTITVGQVSYAVEAGRIDELPEALRPLAQQLLASSPGQVEVSAKSQPATGGGVGVAGGASLEDRVKELEQQNQELQQKLMELTDRLNKEGK